MIKYVFFFLLIVLLILIFTFPSLDFYKKTWMTLLFHPDSFKYSKRVAKNLHYVKFPKGERLALPTPYHCILITKEMLVDKFKKRKQDGILILDGEPNTISYGTQPLTDLIISTKLMTPQNIQSRPSLFPPLSESAPSLHIPYFLYSFAAYKLDPTVLIKKPGEFYPKTKFCCFAYSNCREKYIGVRMRKKFYFLLQKMSNNRVDNLGRCYNSKRRKGKTEKNSNVFKDYKFVIAIENDFIDGYITEKLTNPMFSRTIPIYLGAKNVQNYFNPKSFINVRDFPDMETCARYVLMLDQNDALYQQMQNEPFFYHNKIPSLYLDFLFRGGNIYKQIYSYLPSPFLPYILPHKITSQTVACLTFSDGKIYTNDRLRREAQKSNYFDKVYALGPSDFSEFMNTSRHLGFRVWKPYVIQQTLNSMKEGDILVWMDRSCVIHPFHADEMLNYYNILLDGPKEIIGFEIQHVEKDWDKMDTIPKIYGRALEDNMLKQLSTAVIFFRKSPRTTRFVNQWQSLSCTDHRNDQSIYSLLSLNYHPIVHRIHKFETHKKNPNVAFSIARKKK